MRRYIRNIVLAITIVIIVFWMFFFNILTVYQDWDMSLKLVDEDKLMLFIMFWVLITQVNLIFAVFTWKYKTWFVAYLILTLISFVKFLTYFVYSTYLQ